MQSDGTYTYGYDPDGNCTSRTQIALTASSQFYTLYTWDNRNRLTEVTYENKSSQITSTVQYTYDVENRWIGETVTTYTTPGNLSAGTTTQQEFVYDGNQIVLQFSNTSSFTTGQGTLSPLTGSDLSERYLWGPAVDQLLAQEVSQPATGGQTTLNAGAVDWALTDNQGTVRDMAVYNSTTHVTSIAMHSVYNSFGYLVYQGNPSAGAGVAAVDCLFGYTGQPFDTATGLQNNLNRWYDPSVGRWLSEDPSGLTAGPNPYEYCGNGPTDGIDPSGLAQPQPAKPTPLPPLLSFPPPTPAPAPTPPAPTPVPPPKTKPALPGEPSLPTIPPLPAKLVTEIVPPGYKEPYSIPQDKKKAMLALQVEIAECDEKEAELVWN